MKSKILSIIVAIIGLTSASYAQKGNAIFGGNVVLGAPLGDFRTNYKSVVGIEGFAGFGVTQKVYLTGTLGFQSYAPEPSSYDGVYYGKITMIPLKAGVRFYPANNFFLTGNAGIGLVRDETIQARESRFAYDAGVGLNFSIFSASVHYDAIKRVNAPGSSNAVLLKLGIAIR
jgi:hypothetical protein